MTFNLTSPVTGGAQTGFTAPTYTMTPDVAPTPQGKQWAVTALGGTQAGVTAHSASSPFTVTIVRPVVMKTFPIGSVSNSLIKSVPDNTYKIIVRKGVTPAAGQPVTVKPAILTLPIPAGSDTYDSANVRAMLSLLIGALNQISAGLGDTAVTGIA